MSLKSNYQNWKITTDESAIAWLALDVPGSVNKINRFVLDELASILTAVAQKDSVRALIICSAKENGFIAGADIEQFTQFSDNAEMMHFIKQGQAVFKQLETLPMPSVAMIQGFCLGGGLELALACRYRVAQLDDRCDIMSAKSSIQSSNSHTAKLGLPEILLGIHPGWGGSVRLPRLIGAPQALEMILTGRLINAKTAAKIGLVDAAVPARELKRAVCYYALEKPRPHRPAFFQTLTNYSFVRPLLAKIFRKKIAAKVNAQHYPAPFAVIDNWERVGVQDDQAFTVEAESICTLALTSTATHLIRDFFLRDRLKGLGKNNKDFIPQHVHVVGAGTMGGDIAAWCALQGMQVTLQDRAPKFIAPAIKRAFDLYQKKLKTPREIQAALDRLVPDVEGTGIANADIIIEAIFEDLSAKQALFKEVEARCKPTAILATNTSSIPLDEINVVLKDPTRLIGLHFFNPVALMQLVEVVQGKKSTLENVAKGTTFVRKIDRLPLPVTSHPGFLVNRILMPYLMEAMILLEEGVSAPTIDSAALQFGMPMGPIELADAVGLDICLAVAKNLTQHYGGQVSEQLEKMVSERHLGRKTNKGFYEYKKGKPVKGKLFSHLIANEDLSDRLILRMLNEAVACLREGVIEDADLLDAGMIFGTGFAPFRGGPLYYAKQRGVAAIVAKLKEFADKYGARFKPDEGWSNF